MREGNNKVQEGALAPSFLKKFPLPLIRGGLLALKLQRRQGVRGWGSL